MKCTIIAALFACTNAVTLRQMSGAEWPSVARCNAGDVSKDSAPCDHDNRMEHPHDGTVLQTAQQWPSVARCNAGDVSKDSAPCDHDNRMEHPHDGTVLQTASQWPSVARCNAGDVSKDSAPCDHDNRMEHPHDGTTLQLQYRPPIKCIDPIHGNPVSCDHDDIMDWSALPKDENGFTPTKIVPGGPLVDEFAAAEAKNVASAKK